MARDEKPETLELQLDPELSVELQFDHDLEKCRLHFGHRPKTQNLRYEECNPTPVAAPLNLRRGPDIFDHMRAVIRRELSEQAAGANMETFEEADDFDVDEDPFPVSRFDNEDEPTIAELRAQIEELAKAAAETTPPESDPPSNPPKDQALPDPLASAEREEGGS